MAVVPTSKTAKILVLDLPYLPTKELKNLIVHCPTLDDLVVQADKYNTCVVIIVCTSAHLPQLSPILVNLTFDTLYVLNVDEKVSGSVESWWNRTTIVHNEQHLMRHLCTKSVLCYYNESMEHRHNGDNGIANACLLDALRILDYSEMFI